MKVAHLFLKYPNKYQPYNVRLIERQMAGGIRCHAFSFTGVDASKHATDLSLTIRNKIKFVIYALRHISELRAFLKNRKTSVRNSLLLMGRFSAIVLTKPDILHVHHVQLIDDYFLKLLNIFRLKWVVSLRGFETAIRPLLSKKDHAFIFHVLSHAYGIHAVSNDLKHRAIKLGIEPSRIKVIRRSVEEFQPIVKRELNYENEINLTIVCRFNWKKGLVFSLQALRLLLDGNLDVKLHISGDGNINEESEIRYWIWLLKLEGRAILHGFLDSAGINELLSKTHIYLQPSINEGIPNTLIRAVANNIPVVASGIDGIPEIVQDGVHGLLVQPGKPEEIARAVLTLLKDVRLRERISSAVLMNVSFNAENEINLYQEFYSSILLN